MPSPYFKPHFGPSGRHGAGEAVLERLAGLRIVRYRANLRRQRRYVVASEDIPWSDERLFLGKGFRWDQRHTQRPTRDADLLGFGPDDIDSVAAVFRDICVIKIDDGIAFEARLVKTAEIRKEAGYGGVRVELRATLGGAQLSLQIDIGFGDVVTPAPETVSYPVLLDDLPAPTLRAYPKYTVVAEKF